MKIVFGAGCFWGVQNAFDKLPVKTVVGYMGGRVTNPSYEQVCMGTTGHTEVVLVEYNPKEVSLKELLEVFWKVHDPTSFNKTQYKSVIFYYHKAQETEAVKSMYKEEEKRGRTVLTEIKKAGEFYRAEDYHQKYYLKTKNPYS
jgi:peptide-methionine (S)-S-oxide reductase